MTKNLKKKNQLQKYLRFSGVAIQMGAVIAMGALGGRWIDERQGNETPGWTIGLSLFAVFASLYLVIKEVIKLGKDDDKAKEEQSNK